MSRFDKTSRIWRGPDAPYPFPLDLHISEMIFNRLKETPERVVQIYEENCNQMTCEEFRLEATRVAQNLTKLGARDGDVIGFICNNSEKLSVLVNGCVFIGAIPNPMFIDHINDDLIHMWKQTKPKFVFCDSDVIDKVVEVLKDVDCVAIICTTQKRRVGNLFVDDILAPTGDEENFQPFKCKKPYEKTLALLGSSGTSGPSKPVILTQAIPLQIAQMLNYGKIRIAHFGSIYWILPFTLNLIPSLTELTRVVTRRPRITENYIHMIENLRVGYLFMDPTVINNFLQSPLVETADLSSLKIVSSVGAVTHPELREKFRAKFPDKKLITPYGSTEIIFTLPQLDDLNDGYSVGRLMSNFQAKIIDDYGVALDNEECGEVCAKSIFPFMVSSLEIIELILSAEFSHQGYFNNPEASQNAIDADGFVKTGDIGYFDETGLLYLVDRKKDIFKYNFHQVRIISLT